MLIKTYKLRQIIFRVSSLVLSLVFSVIVLIPNEALALARSGGGVTTTTPATQHYCGGGSQKVAVSIDFGCQGKGNPIIDMLFAVIRLLSDGVGLVIIASLIVAGIQFTSSRGDPQATANATKRIQSNVTALILFFFTYAILNYLVPGAVL